MTIQYIQLAFFFGLVTLSLFAVSEFFTSRNRWSKRVKAVVHERRAIREQVKQRESGIAEEVTDIEKLVRSFLDQVRIEKIFDVQKIQQELSRAGKRNRSHLIWFLMFRAISPFAGVALVALLLPYLTEEGYDSENLLLWLAGGLILGFVIPSFWLQRQVESRKKRLERVFPDVIDLLLIFIESGSSIESAIARVSQEIGISSVDMAEEMMLTAAELSYLNDRRQAYENFATRTGVDGIKAVTSALVQAERYGTSLGKTLRVIASDFRRSRIIAAERKAATASTKMTIPMIFGFMPLIFVIILGPGYVQFTQGL